MVCSFHPESIMTPEGKNDSQKLFGESKMIKEALAKVLLNESLDVSEAFDVMNFIMTGQATDAQIAGFLIALKLKGESVDEVTGFVKSMRTQMVKINLNDKNAIDGCGTGGDGKDSFQYFNRSLIGGSFGRCHCCQTRQSGSEF